MLLTTTSTLQGKEITEYIGGSMIMVTASGTAIRYRNA